MNSWCLLFPLCTDSHTKFHVSKVHIRKCKCQGEFHTVQLKIRNGQLEHEKELWSPVCKTVNSRFTLCSHCSISRWKNQVSVQTVSHKTYQATGAAQMLLQQSKPTQWVKPCGWKRLSLFCLLTSNWYFFLLQGFQSFRQPADQCIIK